MNSGQVLELGFYAADQVRDLGVVAVFARA